MLKKIRQGLIEKRENPYPEIDPTPLYPDTNESLDILFAEELTKVNGHFIYCENELQFVENLLALSDEQKWRHIFCWENKLQEILRECEFPFYADDKDFELADVGITLCEALVARNGSILMSSAQNSGRRLPIFPHAHIVVAYASQLVTDLKDGFQLLRDQYGDRLPSYCGIVTGPSRTADIEKTLVLGAHGPRELFVFLLED